MPVQRDQEQEGGEIWGTHCKRDRALRIKMGEGRTNFLILDMPHVQFTNPNQNQDPNCAQSSRARLRDAFSIKSVHGNPSKSYPSQLSTATQNYSQGLSTHPFISASHKLKTRYLKNIQDSYSKSISLLSTRHLAESCLFWTLLRGQF